MIRNKYYAENTQKWPKIGQNTGKYAKIGHNWANHNLIPNVLLRMIVNYQI
jgi:hypothetical protein